MASRFFCCSGPDSTLHTMLPDHARPIRRFRQLSASGYASAPLDGLPHPRVDDFGTEWQIVNIRRQHLCTANGLQFQRASHAATLLYNSE